MKYKIDKQVILESVAEWVNKNVRGCTQANGYAEEGNCDSHSTSDDPSYNGQTQAQQLPENQPQPQQSDDDYYREQLQNISEATEYNSYDQAVKKKLDSLGLGAMEDRKGPLKAEDKAIKEDESKKADETRKTEYFNTIYDSDELKDIERVKMPKKDIKKPAEGAVK